MLKPQHHLHIYSRTKWFDYATSFFLFPFFFHFIIIEMFLIPFTWMFEFISPTSILELAITPTFDNFYPPPILTKHSIWYSINTNLFISLCGISYGLHWQHFQNSILFQEIITHGETHLIGLLAHHLIPFNILKHNLFNNFLIFLYHGTIKLSHLTRDDWIDLKWLCVDWYFPSQTAIIIWKFCELRYQQLPPMQWHLIQSLPVQQILRQQNQEEEHWQQIHLIQVKDSEEEKEICIKDNST